MKKTILLFLVLTMAFSLSLAGDLMYGVKTGLTLNSLNWDPDAEEMMGEDLTEKMLWGTCQGIFVIYPLGEKLSLQGDILFIRKGHKLELNDVPSDVEVYMKVLADYIEVPLLLRYEIAEGLFLAGGPAIAFNTKAEMREEIEEGDDHYAYGEFADDYIKSIDFAAVLGLQYVFAERFLSDFRYDMGLTDINDSPDGDGPESIKTRTMTLSIGYIF